MELGCKDHNLRVRQEYSRGQRGPHGQIPRLPAQLRRRHQVSVDERILSAGVRKTQAIHPKRTMARERNVGGRKRRDDVLSRKHPA